MPSSSYFSLATSDASLSKKFSVIQSGYEITKEKAQTINTTINGGLDISFGAIHETHNYIVRVRHTEPRTDYGSMSDLAAFYSLNNPNGTITPVITLTDHYGGTHSVYIVGAYVPTPLSVSIEGANAWFNIKCSFRLIPEVV